MPTIRLRDFYHVTRDVAYDDRCPPVKVGTQLDRRVALLAVFAAAYYCVPVFDLECLIDGGVRGRCIGSAFSGGPKITLNETIDVSRGLARIFGFLLRYCHCGLRRAKQNQTQGP